MKIIFVNEIYVEDCEFTIITDTIICNKNSGVIFYSRNNDSDFIITADYYPTDYWEWFGIKTSSLKQLGVLSSSYDKGSHFGITNLGYNGWKPIMIKLENKVLTLQYSSTIVSKDVSSEIFPDEWLFMTNRNGTRIKNFKVKQL